MTKVILYVTEDNFYAYRSGTAFQGYSDSPKIPTFAVLVPPEAIKDYTKNSGYFIAKVHPREKW